MEKQPYSLHNNIRLIRRGKADITQEKLADKVGCTRQTIAALEKGVYNPSLVLAMRIAKVLQVEIVDLFKLQKTN